MTSGFPAASSPSSAVAESRASNEAGWGVLSADFLHYILHDFAALRQRELELGEELGDVWLGLGDNPQTQFSSVIAPGNRKDHVHGFDGGNVADQLAGAAAEMFLGHPHFQRAPKRQRQEADQDVGLDSIGLLVVDRTQRKVALGGAECGFGLT